MSLNNYYTIYRHVSPSGKSYIGVTRQKDLNRRWMSGHGYKSCPLFNNAIQKYGWKNFTHEILEDYVPIDNINEKECYWIKKYKSNNREYGYNIEEGGHAYRTFSKETRKKISEAVKGKPKSIEHKKKLSEANLGHHLSESVKQQISERQKKPVAKLDEDGNIIEKFPSAKEAAESINRDPSSLAKCCRGVQKTCGKYRWRYLTKEEVAL